MILLLLEGICLSFIVQGGPRQKDILLNTTGLMVNATNERISRLNDYLHLTEQIRELKTVNAQLYDALPSSRYDNVLVKDTLGINDSLYTYIEATIISKSTYGANNTMILNRGGAHGVEKGMGVIGGGGVIGIVEDTSHYFCKVVSILNTKSRISASVISRDTSNGKTNDTFGVLVWDYDNPRYVTLTDIPRYHEVRPGDTIRTSGYSFAFPSGITIGTIEGSPTTDTLKTGMHNIHVRLGNDPIRVKHAYIVKMDKTKKADLLRLERDDSGYEQ